MTSLKYHRGMAHWMEFVSLAQKRSYGGSLRLVVLAMGAAPMLLAIVLDARWPGSLDPMSVLFGMLGTLLLVSVLSKVGARRHVRETGWILGDREITLREDGLTDAGKGAVLNVTWPAIEDVSVAKGVVVLWMDSAAGIFIPRHAFASAEQERNFVAFVQTHAAK